MMTAFVIGFIFMMLFVVMVGIAALVFISFDAPQDAHPARQESRYTAVRIIDTQEIETTDSAGQIQRWRRSA